MIHRPRHINNLKPGSLFLAAFCAAILLWTAAAPFCRAFRLEEINYNEGWNVYNAQRVAEHQPLYPSDYGWTTVNYPALSFHLVAALGRSFSNDYLFTARILSLAGLCLSGVLAGLIIGHTTRSRIAAWFSGVFLVASFCAIANGYVGMDDPQMFSQVFFLAGLYVYLKGGRRGRALDLAALLFVLGGNIKHNLIEFPLAVLLDLLFNSPRRALRFAGVGALMAAFSVVLTSRVDGAAYLSCLLAPRFYSVRHGFASLSAVLMLALLPAVTALLMACNCWKNPSRRVLVLLLFCALVSDTYFCGGSGVVINGMFGTMLAIILLNGVFWVEYSSLPLGQLKARPPLVVCSIHFLWLVVPMLLVGNWRTNPALRQSHEKERRFAVETAYLRQRPDPAICESLLLCYYAGKPYLYDPFNATRFIYMGKLNSGVIVDQLRNREYGAVQLTVSPERRLAAQGVDTHFARPILLAIRQYYRPGLTNEDGIIYLPKE